MHNKEMIDNKILGNIAMQSLDIKTLETRNSDELDFYNLPVWMFKEALEKAFKVGQDYNERSIK